MPIKGNSFKSNLFKHDPDSNKTGQKQPAGKTSRIKADLLPTFDLQDGRFVKIIGLFFVIIALYFFIAFTSYAFTWQEDQSYVIDANGGWSNLFKTLDELESSGVTNPLVENWLGKFGALLSHQFIYEWFGICLLYTSRCV